MTTFQVWRAIGAGVAGMAALLGVAPARASRQDQQLWLQANANVGIAPRLRVTLEQIARFGDRPNGLYQTEYGALFGYRIAKAVEIGVGYRHVSLYNGSTGPDENRVRQQIVATFGPVFTRFRVDERFRTDGGEVGVRIRPLLRYNLKVKADGLALFVSHESFVLANSTRWGQRNGYERMRNIIGVTVPVGRAMAADIGYLNQYRPSRGGARAQMDHALSMQLTVNLDTLIDRSPHD